jgi:hypothetical protein
MRFFVSLRMTIVASVRFVGHFNPFKPKDLTNPFGKSYPQMLRAGLELHSFQIVCGGLGRGPAEYCQQSSRKQAEK